MPDTGLGSTVNKKALYSWDKYTPINEKSKLSENERLEQWEQELCELIRELSKVITKTGKKFEGSAISNRNMWATHVF